MHTYFEIVLANMGNISEIFKVNCLSLELQNESEKYSKNNILLKYMNAKII